LKRNISDSYNKTEVDNLVNANDSIIYTSNIYFNDVSGSGVDTLTIKSDKTTIVNASSTPFIDIDSTEIGIHPPLHCFNNAIIDGWLSASNLYDITTIDNLLNTINTDLSNCYTKTESDALYYLENNTGTGTDLINNQKLRRIIGVDGITTSVYYNAADVNDTNNFNLLIEGTSLQNDINTKQDLLNSGEDITVNVGRGHVYLEDNGYDNADNGGLTLRAANNPTNGAIFSVRSSGHSNRLFCGQNITSSGENAFGISAIVALENMHDPDNYRHYFDSNGARINGDLTVSGTITSTRIYLDAYMSNSGTNFDNDPMQIVELNTLRNVSSHFTLNNYEITINTQMLAQISFRITTNINSNTQVRSMSVGWLQIDTGSGFSALEGTDIHMYNRMYGYGLNGGSASLILPLNVGDKLRMMVIRAVGGDTLRVWAHATSIQILAL
jgi:hypothetical protein